MNQIGFVKNPKKKVQFFSASNEWAHPGECVNDDSLDVCVCFSVWAREKKKRESISKDARYFSTKKREKKIWKKIRTYGKLEKNSEIGHAPHIRPGAFFWESATFEMIILTGWAENWSFLEIFPFWEWFFEPPVIHREIIYWLNYAGNEARKRETLEKSTFVVKMVEMAVFLQ